MSRVVCAETGAALWTLEQERLETGDERVIGSLPAADVVTKDDFETTVAAKDGEIRKLREQLAHGRPLSDTTEGEGTTGGQRKRKIP